MKNWYGKMKHNKYLVDDKRIVYEIDLSSKRDENYIWLIYKRIGTLKELDRLNLDEKVNI